MRRWVFSASFPESDIIWDGLSKDSVTGQIKTAILWVFLLLFSIVLLTPILLINMSAQIIENIDTQKDWMDNNTFNTYLSTSMTMFMNVILIPFFIDIMVLIEDHQTKS